MMLGKSYIHKAENAVFDLFTPISYLYFKIDTLILVSK